MGAISPEIWKRSKLNAEAWREAKTLAFMMSNGSEAPSDIRRFMRSKEIITLSAMDIFMSTLMDILDHLGVDYPVKGWENIWEDILYY